MRRAGDAPGPRGLPFVGVFLEARRDPLTFFLETMRTHGDVACMRFGHRRAYLLSHPRDVRHVLEDEEGIYAKGPAAARVRPLFGDSLTTLDGERWRRRRRLMRPAFQPGALVPCLPVVTDTAARMLDRWSSSAERGETLDVSRETAALTREIVIRLVLGDAGEAQLRALGDALEETTEAVSRRLWSPFGSLELPGTGRRRLRAALRAIDLAVGGTVARAREAMRSGGALLTALLGSHDVGGERMDEAELARELEATLFAGQTTTASALAWTFHALATNPAVTQSVAAEVRDVLGRRVPGVDDLPALTRLRRVIHEVLRLYPPTWVTARTPLRDDRAGGHPIPAGSLVLLSAFVTHRHPAFWPEPDRFDPDRFAPDRRAEPYAFFPFGGGPRTCIGAWLASVEVRLVVAMALQRYELTLAPGSAVDLDPGLTLRPRPGVPVVVRPMG